MRVDAPSNLTAGSSDAGLNGEPGLFVVWSAAGDARDWIVADLASRFIVTRVCEIRWTPARVIRNYERFYSDLDVRGVYHRFNKGAGPFTVVTVVDPDPVYENRTTARGLRPVNARFLDAKLDYRARTGGLEVHCGETAFETRRDTVMLLGPDAIGPSEPPARSQGPAPGTAVERLQSDPPGAVCWPSVEAVTDVLNVAANYCVLHGERRAPDQWRDASAVPIELLTDDFAALHAILNARPPRECAPAGGMFRVPVASGDLVLGLRFVADGYFDARWAASALDNRVLHESGFYVPAPDDERYLNLYHRCVHVPQDRRSRDRRPGDRAAGDGGAAEAQRQLAGFLRDHGYGVPIPKDPRTGYRPPGDDPAGDAVRMRRFGRRFDAAVTYARGRIVVAYRAARDRILLRAQWLRSVKRLLTGRRPARATQ